MAKIIKSVSVSLQSDREVSSLDNVNVSVEFGSTDDPTLSSSRPANEALSPEIRAALATSFKAILDAVKSQAGIS